jgi:dethiobiotin synthase
VSRYVLVTGTDTGVGKTVTTAALCCWHLAGGRDVVVVKPTQTGVRVGEPGDIDEMRRLSGLAQGSAHELLRLPEPLAPESAALRSGTPIPAVADLAAQIAERTERGPDASHVVLVEGAGGVAVRLDLHGGTALDLGRALEWHGDVEVIVVTRAGLGTLNHTVLTVEAVRSAGLPVAGLVIGSWPADPDLAAVSNLEDLPRVSGARLLAAIPAGVGAAAPLDFQAAAPGWFGG